MNNILSKKNFVAMTKRIQEVNWFFSVRMTPFLLASFLHYIKQAKTIGRGATEDKQNSMSCKTR